MPTTIHEHIANEAEGNLFRERYVLPGFRNNVSFHESFYVCRNGECYSIHPDTLEETKSGDPLIDLVSQCEKLGPYEDNKHKIVRTEFREVTADQLYKFFLPRKRSK